MQSSMLSFICYNSVLAICRELLSIPYKWTAAHIVVKNIPSILDGVFSSFSTRELLQKNFCVYFSLFLPSTVHLYACTSTRKKKSEQYLAFVFPPFKCLLLQMQEDFQVVSSCFFLSISPAEYVIYTSVCIEVISLQSQQT